MVTPVRPSVVQLSMQLEGYTLHEREGGEVGRGEERGSTDDGNDDRHRGLIHSR